jgi:hypothetical protein
VVAMTDWSPREARRAIHQSRLTSTEKLVILAIVDHWSTRFPKPTPGMSRLQEWCSLTRPTVLKTIASLVAKGVIPDPHQFEDDGSPKSGTGFVYDLSELVKRLYQLPVKRLDHSGRGKSPRTGKVSLPDGSRGTGKVSLPVLVKSLSPTGKVHDQVPAEISLDSCGSRQEVGSVGNRSAFASANAPQDSGLASEMDSTSGLGTDPTQPATRHWQPGTSGRSDGSDSDRPLEPPDGLAGATLCLPGMSGPFGNENAPTGQPEALARNGRKRSKNPAKQKPQPAPGHQEVMAHYAQEFERKRGAKPIIGGAEGSAVKNLLKKLKGDVAKAKRIITNALESWKGDTVTIMQIARDPSAFAAPAPARKSRNAMPPQPNSTEKPYFLKPTTEFDDD